MEGQQYSGEYVGGARAPVSEDCVARPPHVFGGGRIPDELEGKVAGREFGP